MLEGANWVDYVIIAFIGASVLMGLFRGFVRETISLITWIVAITLAILYYEQVAALSYFASITIEGIRLLLAFILLILGTLIVGGIINYLVSRAVTIAGFSVTDRIVGTIFGFVRGVAIIAFVIMLTTPTRLTQEHLWQTSLLIPKFEPIASWAKDRFPQDFTKRLET